MATIEQRGESFRVIFKFCGRRFTRSLKTKNRKAAAASVARLEDNLRRVELGLLTPPDGADLPAFLLSDGQAMSRPTLAAIETLESLLAKYFTSLPEGALEDSTIRGMQVHRGHLLRVLGKKFLIQGLEAPHLQGYIEARSAAAGSHGRKISGATIKKEIVTLRTVWNWSIHMGFVRRPFPNRGLKYPKIHEKPPFQTLTEVETRLMRGGLLPADEADLWDCVFLTLPEIEELLDYVKRSAREPHVFPMFLFAAHTGCRRSEMLRSQIEDINFTSQTILIREKKRVRGKRSTRRVPMTPLLAEALREWFAKHPGGNDTFAMRTSDGPRPVSVDDAHHCFKRTLASTRWAALRGWHVWRHSFCSNCAARGVDQRIINAWTGHQTEEIIRRYRHLIPNQEQQAIKSVFG
jgi:integrase